MFSVIKEEPMVKVSSATPVVVGGTFSACVLVIIVIGVLVIR